jgi:hypothetical protein
MNPLCSWLIPARLSKRYIKASKGKIDNDINSKYKKYVLGEANLNKLFVLF